MEKDLFQINLDNIQFSNVEQFTGLDRPENERPKEGVLIDFNEQIPDDIGDVVAAFANTYGGLVILGVKSDKTKQNIPVDIPGIPGTSDIKANIVNKILSTVYPRPPFSVGVVQHSRNTSNIVVVIKVEQSQNTPHMYMKSQKNKISVRIEDENRYASLQQIEALFEKRKRLTEQDVTQRLDDLYVMCKYDGVKNRSSNYHKLSFLPYDDLNIRLDRKSERDFENIIRRIFKNDSTIINNSHRNAKYYQIQADNESEDYPRIWRLYSFGAIEFISQLGKGLQKEENLGDMIVDAISIIKLYENFLKDLGCFGKIYFRHEISIAKKTKFLSKMPPPSNLGNYDCMSGIKLGRDSVDSQIFPNEHIITRNIDFSNIEAPEEMIAENFLEHFRALFQGSIKFDDLLEQIRHLRRNIV